MCGMIQTHTRTHTRTSAHPDTDAHACADNHAHTNTLTDAHQTHVCTPNCSLKNLQKCNSRHPKELPNTIQNHPQRPPENKEALGHRQRHQKINFGRPSSPSCMPKEYQNRGPKGEKTLQNHVCMPNAREQQFWLQFGTSEKAFRKQNSPL